ncbi:MAG: hypothetical protein WA584_20240 [Pyrinomonadaceae bacterium]
MIMLGSLIGGCIPCVSVFLDGSIAVGVFYTFFTKMRGRPLTGRFSPTFRSRSLTLRRSRITAELMKLRLKF